MTSVVEARCATHPDAIDCPDAVVIYWARYDEYGLPIRDGGTSAITIAFCPWCGCVLPESKRELWFETLEARGLADADDEQIPAEFKTDAWWRNPKG